MPDDTAVMSVALAEAHAALDHDDVPRGEVRERPNRGASKASRGFAVPRGFKSRPLRHESARCPNRAARYALFVLLGASPTTCVTGTPNSRRVLRGRSCRSHFDIPGGSVEMMISSIGRSRKASRIA